MLTLSYLFFASLLAAILGIAIDRIVYQPLRKSNSPGLVFLIASFGVFIFIQNLLQLLYGAQILILRTGPVKEGYQLSVFGYQLNAVITDIQILILVVGALLSVSLFLMINKTKMGKAIRVVADDQIGASVSGIYLEVFSSE